MRYFSRTILPAVVAIWAVGLDAEDADTARVARGPVPAWAAVEGPLAVPPDASGLAFVRQNATVVHLDKAGQQTFVAQRFRLLQPQALQIGNVAIAWNPAAGAPVLHTLRVHRDGQAIDLTQSAQFEILRREDNLEQAMLSGVLTAIYKVPDLRVGDDLEVSFTLPTNDPTLRDENSGLLALAGTNLPGRYELGVTWEPGDEPLIRSTDDFGAATAKGSDGFRVKVDNPPLLDSPKRAPPRYAWQRVIEFSEFASWQDVSKRFAPLYANAAVLAPDSPLKAEAARIAASHADPMARAQAALALVQDQVRYIYVGLNGGNLQPASADETWQRRYGDCKGKTVLLLALLNELGIPAEAVLASNSGSDDGLDQRLALPGSFDHVLVRTAFGGKTWWLDGTMPGVVGMDTAPIAPYRWVLPLAAGGRALEHVAQAVAPLPDEMGLFEIDARAGFDKPATKRQSIVKRGLEGVGEYMQMSLLSNDQLTQTFRNAAAGGSEWDTIDKVSYHYDKPTRASVLTIEGTGPVDWDKSGGSYDLVLPGGGFSPPDRRQRPADQDQSAPYYNDPGYSCYATTVRLPEKTDLKNWGFNSIYDTLIYGRVYYRMMEKRDDRTIRMVRGSRVERPEITPAVAARDNDRLARFDNSKANITYDPGQTMTPYGDLKPVPATWEIDWTGANVPCLPSDVLKTG